MQLLYVGIDVSKSKHDCFIMNDEGECLVGVFTIENSKSGFRKLYARIKEHCLRPSLENVRVGLEATGHYSHNLISFLDETGLRPVVFNPLQTNLYRKGQSLRKTKTDKVDARFIAKMLTVEGFAPHMPPSYHIEELKWLTRNRARLVRQQSGFKVSYARLLDLVFPELARVVNTTLKSVTEALLEFPCAKAMAQSHLTRLTGVLHRNSQGRFGKDKAIELRDLARQSIGSDSPALTMELQQTIRMIKAIGAEIDLIEHEIEKIVLEINPPFLQIKGIGYRLAAIILAEVGNFRRFLDPNKLQAYAGLDPSVYQSGNFDSTKDVMVKRGSTYLRWALMQAGRLASVYDPTFRKVLERKLSEGKHYNVAVSHVAKKLIRVIHHLMLTGEEYVCQM